MLAPVVLAACRDGASVPATPDSGAVVFGVEGCEDPDGCWIGNGVGGTH